MAGASPSADWRCVPCAAFAGVEYNDPTEPTSKCADCNSVASPCAVLRAELIGLREAIRTLHSSPVVVAPTPAVANGSVADSGEPYLTAQQVADYLGKTREAVYVATQRGQLPAHRLGDTRGLRFLKTEIDAELARR